MRILVCPDSFKEALPALDAARSIARGLEKSPGIRCSLLPIADGGEGFVDAMLAAGGRREALEVTGPLGEPVEAAWGVLEPQEVGVIEMAAASGLGLVPPEARRPLDATTRGVGQIIGHAVSGGIRRIVIGIGGSATTDGGAGMAQALGVRLLDETGANLPPGGAALSRLAAIDTSGLLPELEGCTIECACDVTNPLLGPEGAAAVYAPQKGASPADVKILEQGLQRFADVAERELGLSVRDLPGAGAAGGLGAGLVLFCGASLRPGFELISHHLRLRETAAASDWIIAGEGKTDATSLAGKAVGGVLDVARSLEKPCIVLTGSAADEVTDLYQKGATAVLAIADGPLSTQESVERTAQLLEKAATNIGRILARQTARGGGVW